MHVLLTGATGYVGGYVLDALLERGEGRFVMPRPPRLVVLGGAPHMVAPVRAAAGSNVRATVSGFFLREPLADEE